MNKKFTLIELIVVIAILGILASLIVPNISSFKGDATITAIHSNIRNFQTAIDMYNLKNNGQYPTAKQPTEFIPEPIDFTKLDKNYLKTLPKTEGVKYWVDFQGKVWASTIDAPTGVAVNNTTNNITWEAVQGATKYQVFELQGYQGVIGTLTSSKANLVFKIETSTTNYTGEIGKAYVVTALDEQNFQSAPSGVGYLGYVSPSGDNPTIPEDNVPTEPVFKPIQITEPQGYVGIYTLEDLNNIRNNLSGKYILMKNLDFNKNADYTNIANKTTWTTGSGWEPVGYGNTPFTGTFDGNGLSISNLYINRGVTDYVGLFGRTTTTGSEVKNVSVLNANVTGNTYTGILVGEAPNINISNVFTSGNVQGVTCVGGLVGRNSGNINIVGTSANVVGTNYDVGGLVGKALGPITNAYATGDVSGNQDVGGLVGYQYANITNSYATGKVIATGINSRYIGGLVGYWYSLNTTNSYWNTEISNYEISQKGTQLNGSSMFLKEKFVGFDFINIWDIQEGTTMPYLRGLPIPENIKKINLTGKYIPFAGGKGTTNDPYLISSEQQLNNIRKELSASYKLINNITLTLYQSGSGWEPIGYGNSPFTGTFDGNGLSISNLYINRGVTEYVGLFGRTSTASSEIKNISILDANVTGGDTTGILVGQAYGSKVNNAFSSGSVRGISFVGGLVGQSSGPINIAGSSANVVGTNHDVGGLIGKIGNTLTNAYASGDVSGNNSVGGLVGYQFGNITNIYSTGKVTATGTNTGYIGGLIGNRYSGTTTNSYWNTETSGYATSQGGTTKTTIQMKQQATYVGWDFTNTWTINEGNDYPKLK